MKKTTVFTNLKSTYFQEKSYFNAIKDSKSVSFHLGARDGGIGPLLGATGGAESGALGDGRTEIPPCRTEAGSLSGGRGLESSGEGVG